MRENIHPDYHDIKIIMTDGTEYVTKSTWGKAGDTMRLDVDSKSHPAWTGGEQKLMMNDQMDKFSKRFSNFKVSAGSKREEKKTEEKKA
jgi:large subunit ribosomal protein L31